VTVGQMAAGVAHEIANPLASMDSVLQLMQRHERYVTPEKVQLLGEQVKRIKAILRLLGNFAHPTDYHWEEQPLNAVMESALQMVRFDHRLRTVRLEVEPAPPTCSLRVQPHAVQQALTNLLMNALDALAETPEATLR